MTPTTRYSELGNVRIRLCVCVFDLYVRAALCSYRSVHSQRFGQHAGFVVDRGVADAAPERRQIGVRSRNCNAIWWTDRGTVIQLMEEIKKKIKKNDKNRGHWKH